MSYSDIVNLYLGQHASIGQRLSCLTWSLAGIWLPLVTQVVTAALDDNHSTEVKLEKV